MRITRWALGVLGTATMAYAAFGLAPHARLSKVTKVVPWLVGAAVVHDAVVAPLVFAFGALVVAHIPPPYRRAAQGGLLCSAVVTLFSIPFVRGYGRAADLPSALPRNYASGLALVLGVVAVLTVGVIARARRRG